MSAALSPPSLHTEAHQALDQARHEARLHGSRFAGSMPPKAAWALIQAGAAQLVDVRSP